ncbi:MAG: hypothetical protein IJI48_01575 [Ruminococcus sp.]|nr:hypothetical protein [Ruminococcus sp.]
MKKIISMLLVVAMIVAMAAIGMATTSAAQTATVTVYDLNGNAVTEEYDVGEEFTVYTTLDVTKSVSSGLIGSVQGTQTYTSSALELVNEFDSQYGEIVDLNSVFPITRSATMSNASVAGKVTFNASTPSKTDAFKFDSSAAKLIVTTYRVKAASPAEVKTAIRNLAIADDELTRIVFEGKTQTGKSYSMASTFTDPLTLDHAEITIHSLDGTTDTITANIGDEFTVYTTLNVSESVTGGKIGSINANQKYTSSVLTLADAVDSDGLIEDVEKVFPVLGSNAMANAATKGTITYAASTPYTDKAFVFNDDTCQLITTTYKVKANGVADITNNLIVLGTAENPIKALVKDGVIQDGAVISMPASFNLGPAPTTLAVTITGPNGKAETKEFNVNDTFTVYTVLNTSSIANGNIANVAGSQSFTTSKLQLTDSYDSQYGEVDNVEAMFPILGGKAMATVQNGVITFSASKPEVNNGFVFNNDKCKLIVTNYKVKAAGKANITTALKTMVASDKDVTKIVWNGETQSGKSFTMFETYTDPGSSTQPTQPTQPATQPTQPTQPATKPTQPVTQPTEAAKDTTVTIYGFDGKSVKMSFNVGQSFTVYSTFNASKAVGNGYIASINATQTYTSSILKETDSVDQYGVITDNATVFPNMTGAMGRVVDGVVKYNASNPQQGYLFNTDESIISVTHYTVTAKGNAEIRDAMVTVAAADAALTRIVSKGVVTEGNTIGGKATFTEPGKEPVTEPTTSGNTILLGDVNDDGEVDAVDSTLVQRKATLVKVPYSDELMMRGDVDGDGDLTVVDATYLLRHSSLAKTPYPIGQYVTR